MPLAYPLPFGLRDVHVAPLSNAGVAGTALIIPANETLTFEEAEDFETLRGDDGVIAFRGKGPFVNWSLEAGGISMEVWACFSGATLTTTGVTPNQVKTIHKIGTNVRPYVLLEGQAYSDTGADFHVKLWRARPSGPLKGEMKDGTFWHTGLNGMALPDPNNSLALYDFVQNETPTAIIP